MEDLLAQTRLVLAPAVAQFTPVTLPYGYQPSSKADKTFDKKNAESVSLILEDSTAFLVALENKHKSRIEEYETWKAKKIESERAERRRIAPGYLDGPNRILVPDRPAQPGAVPQTLEKAAKEAPVEKDEPEQTIDSLKGLQL